MGRPHGKDGCRQTSGLECGGHHPVTVLLASVEHLGIEDHLIYQIHQKSYIDLLQ